jgi:hypothetical protein
MFFAFSGISYIVLTALLLYSIIKILLIVNYPAAELRGIKNQKQDVPDSDTSFIEFTLLPLDHKARIFTTILSRLRRVCFHPHSRAVGYSTVFFIKRLYVSFILKQKFIQLVPMRNLRSKIICEIDD